MKLRAKDLLLSVLLVVTSASLMPACSDDGGGGTGGGGGAGQSCPDLSDVSGSPSFQDDVMPIFAVSCALSSSCHAAPSGMEGLVLGQPMSEGPPDQALIDTVHVNIVGAPSSESSLPRVEAGDPAGSWLLLKAAYTTAELTSCETGCAEDCGDSMPPGSPLDDDRVETIAAWIASGAPNN